MFSVPLKPEDHAILITGPNKGAFGTGFAIYADDVYTYVVTAYHVVKDVSGEKAADILVDGLPAELIACDYDKEGFDLAVLRVVGQPRWRMLQPKFGARRPHTAGTRVRTAGYYMYGDARELSRLDGTLGAPAQWASTKLKAKTDVWHFQLDAGNTLKHGYSGSPLVDMAGEVIGVVIYHQDSGVTGRAVAVEALLSVWPEMPLSLRSQTDGERSTLSPPFPPLMDRDNETSALRNILEGTNRHTHVVVVVGESGWGKTRLVDEYEYLVQQYGRRYELFRLGAQLRVDVCLDRLAAICGINLFPNYRNTREADLPEPLTPAKIADWHGKLTHSFLGDLSRSLSNDLLVVIFDQYEKADPQLKDWLARTLLPQLAWQPMLVIVAGQEPVVQSGYLPGQLTFQLQGVPFDRYVDYVNRRGAAVSQSELEFMYRLLKGKPKEFVEYVESMIPQGGLV